MMEAEYAGIAVEATTAGAAQAAPLTRFLRENPRSWHVSLNMSVSDMKGVKTQHIIAGAYLYATSIVLIGACSSAGV